MADGSWGRGKLLFTGKKVFPFPKPLPFSRKAEYFAAPGFSVLAGIFPWGHNPPIFKKSGVLCCVRIFCPGWDFSIGSQSPHFQDIMRDTRGLSFFMPENKKWFAS